MGNRAARLCGAALLASLFLLTLAARAAVPPREHQLLTEQSTTAHNRCRPPNPGRTTKDSEVVFGRFRTPYSARLFLRRVQRRGYGRARIEREDCKYEVAIIRLRRAKAERMARRIRRAGWRVRVMVS